ncbi:MAG: pyrroloquinoline-quinone synthase PqqC [Acidobacteriia bacterium]|nr:pyrroloquinoline-quinone synthase PqqC [Terriglobia bacterium]
MATQTFTTRESQLLTRDELRARLQQVGQERYHHRHPFHLLMHEGRLNRGQLQAWALNRYYYQSRIPLKDAIILSRSEDRDFRVAWRKRIVDHDGDQTHEGGIERWLRLGEATGLSRDLVRSGEGVLPATRYAVDAYLDLVKNRTFLEAVASSLTELFSRDLIALRMDALRKHYPWLSGGLDYFTARLTQAPEDAKFAFDYVAANAETRSQQEATIAALRRKCDILWAQLDALHFAYVEPGWPPPGAFVPQGDARGTA